MTAKHTNIGKQTEQMTARWLRENGWPGAERRVRTGYRIPGREVADQGDVLGTPGLGWQVKSLRPATAMELAVPRWLAETEAQRVASGASLGFLVVRRWGTTDVGRWWAFQRLGQLLDMTSGFAADHRAGSPAQGSRIPIRMDMAALAALLHELGWAGTAGTEVAS